ncbi:MAG: serine protein kinase RIO [Fibrobacteria bacterium]|nr:serine protein kinase RIO [Fibrobacteria bacterium]
MRTPPRLLPLVEDGIIDEVLGQVRSGKEADVFIVRVADEIRCAKVYKDSSHRSFKQAASYQEGRRIQNSRSARALSKRSAFGQKEAETNWITAEVQALNTLSAAGVRVPKPHGFFDGVLVMELIVDASGEVAPRLDDLDLPVEVARSYHKEMISQIVRMLCAGIIHGDLSEFNVLVDADGPVIIDLPQAVNAVGNNNAQRMLTRDVENMARYFGRFDPQLLELQYAPEIWSLFQNGLLHPHVELTGIHEETSSFIDLDGVMEAIEDARRENEARLVRKAATPATTSPQEAREGGAEQAARQWMAREGKSRGTSGRRDGGGHDQGRRSIPRADGSGGHATSDPRKPSSPPEQPGPASHRTASAAHPARADAPRPASVSSSHLATPAPKPPVRWGRRPHR